jgi:hypothetical protein
MELMLSISIIPSIPVSRQAGMLVLSNGVSRTLVPRIEVSSIQISNYLVQRVISMNWLGLT